MPFKYLTKIIMPSGVFLPLHRTVCFPESIELCQREFAALVSNHELSHGGHCQRDLALGSQNMLSLATEQQDGLYY